MRECKLCGNLLPVKRLEPITPAIHTNTVLVFYSCGLFNDAFSVIKIIEWKGGK
jgi:hypothetical protein